MTASTVSDFALRLLRPNGPAQSGFSQSGSAQSGALTAGSVAGQGVVLESSSAAVQGIQFSPQSAQGTTGLIQTAAALAEAAAAVKSTFKPLSLARSLLQEMADLTAQAAVAHGGNRADEYGTLQKQYERKADEVAGLVRNTSFSGTGYNKISLVDGAAWQTPGSVVQADFIMETDPLTGRTTRTYAGTGTLAVQAGDSTVSVTLTDFGDTAKAGGHSLTDLFADVPWTNTRAVAINIFMPTDPVAPDYLTKMAEYKAAVAKRNAQYGFNQIAEPGTQSDAASITQSKTQSKIQPETSPETLSELVGTPNFAVAGQKLGELQALVDTTLQGYSAGVSTLERQSAMLRGQADIVQQAAASQRPGTREQGVEGLSLTLLGASIVSERG